MLRRVTLEAPTTSPHYSRPRARYEPEKSFQRGRIFTLTPKDFNADGDFRSREVCALRDELDMVITNPPFRLFCEFITWLMAGNVQFSVIGSQNAITYKEVFPLIKNNKLWLGPSISSGDREFRAPQRCSIYAAGFREENGQKFIRVKGVRWFTNIEHVRRHEPLKLMTIADNLRFNEKLINNSRDKYGACEYQHYDNYDAI